MTADPADDPVLRLLQEAGLEDDAALAALLDELKATAAAEPPAPSRDVVRLMSGRRPARASWFARHSTRTTTVVLLAAALAGERPPPRRAPRSTRSSATRSPAWGSSSGVPRVRRPPRPQRGVTRRTRRRRRRATGRLPRLGVGRGRRRAREPGCAAIDGGAGAARVRSPARRGVARRRGRSGRRRRRPRPQRRHEQRVGPGPGRRRRSGRRSGSLRRVVHAEAGPLAPPACSHAGPPATGGGSQTNQPGGGGEAGSDR